MEELIELQHYSGYFLDISGIGDYHFALFTLGFGFRLLGSRLSILFKRKRLGAAFRISFLKGFLKENPMVNPPS